MPIYRECDIVKLFILSCTPTRGKYHGIIYSFSIHKQKNEWAGIGKLAGWDIGD
jgi:hypothetical protein